MSMIRKLVLVLAFLLTVTAPATAFAATNPYQNLNCNGPAASSVVCQSRGNTTDPITGPQGVLMKVVNLVAFVAGMAAVLFIVLAGIKYITSRGDPQQVSQAKESIIYAAVGLVIIVAARQLIGFVLSKI